MTVYDRTPFVLERIAHYHTLPILRSIIIIWNNPEVEIPQFNSSDYQIPIIFLKQEQNSLNNRFKPRPEIKTECVINMDDDFEMPFDHLIKAFRVWKEHPNQLVGYKHTSRSHSLQDNGRYKYEGQTANGYSIVLPSGLVYHSKYLDLYSSSEFSNARKIVDQFMNCDDILFNFIVSNANQMPPLFLNLHANSKKMSGLWNRPSHFDKRHECMNLFYKEFHKMPLKYTKNLIE